MSALRTFEAADGGAQEPPVAAADCYFCPSKLRPTVASLGVRGKYRSVERECILECLQEFFCLVQADIW